MTSTPGIQRKLADLMRNRRVRAGEVPITLAEKRWHLKETEIFAPLSELEQTWLMENTTMLTCERGRVFYEPDETGEVIFILKRGKVDLYRLTADGRKLTVDSLETHAIFGEMSLIGQGMYGCFAEAVEESTICVLSRSDLQSLIRRNPEVGLRLLGELGKRLQERESELEALAFRTVSNRLAALLLREAGETGEISGMTHQVIADRLGIYRETVSQTLGRFRNEGLIGIEPRQITILDAEGLRRYADPDG